MIIVHMLGMCVFSAGGALQVIINVGIYRLNFHLVHVFRPILRWDLLLFVFRASESFDFENVLVFMRNVTAISSHL